MSIDDSESVTNGRTSDGPLDGSASASGPQSADADSPADSPADTKRGWRLGTDGELYRHLAGYDRAPMVAELARWIDNGPTAEAINRLADSAPHKWAASVKVMANIAGFAERSETIGITAIVDMSDSQLATALKAKLAALGMTDASRLIEHDPVTTLVPDKHE
jgi:hypothetical protein